MIFIIGDAKMTERDASKAPAASGFLALACVGFVASALPPAPARAQAPSDPETGDKADPAAARKLKGVVVTDSAIDGSYKADIDDTPKFTGPLLDTPRSVVVIPKEVIKDTGSATLVEALRTVPGITFGAAEGGNPIGDRPFIRGFDSQGSTYLDGVRDIGAQTREVFDVEQIQIVRGSDSTLGGRGSAGGTLNIVSKMPRNRDFGEVSVSGGTDNYRRATIDVNHKLSDTIGVRLDAMVHDQDYAERDAIYSKRWGVAPSLTVGLGTPTRMTFAYYHLHTNELPDSGSPYLYTIGNAPGTGTILSEPINGRDITTIGGLTGHVDRDTFFGLKDRDFRRSNTDQATWRVEHDTGTGITLRNTARYSHTTQNYIYLQPDDSQGNVFGTSATPSATNLAAQGGYAWRRANTRFGSTDGLVDQLDAYGSFKTGGLEHNFAAGLELSYERADRGAYVVATGSTLNPRCSPAAVSRYYCTSIFNANPNDPFVNYTSDTSNVQTPIVKGGPDTTTINEATTKAAYAFDSITLTDKLILNLGARYDSFDNTTTLPVLNGTRPTVGRKDDLFNYQAGLIFKPTGNTSVYASYATAATPPNSLIGEGREGNGLGTLPTTTTAAGQAAALATLQATAANALKVEKTRSYEVGAKADLFDEALSLNAAVFRTDTENARVTDDGGNIAFIGRSRVKGVEIGFNGNITRTLNVFGGYSYLDATIRDGGFTSLTVAANGPAAATTVLVPSVNTGRRFPQIAKQSATLWANWKPFDKFTIGGGAFYTGRVFGGYADNRTATQTAAGVVTVNPATKVLERAIPGYVRFDASAGYTFNDHLDVRLNVQNLTNKLYYSQAYTSHYAAIAPGRSGFLTLTAKY